MNQLPWFRMFHEARNDAKLRLLSDAEFRVWFNLLCLSSEQRDERGTIPEMDPWLLAAEVANGDEALVAGTLAKLVRLRIAAPSEDGGWRFINFLERQYDKPSDQPQATRERKRKSRVTGRDAPTETTMSRDVTPGHAQEEIREEKNREEQRREESERPARRVRAREAPAFSPESPTLSPDDLEAQAAQIGTDAETLRTAILPQWADKRLGMKEPPNGWHANLRGFGRVFLERRPAGGTRAPPVTFAQQREANNAAAWEELDAVVKGTGNGLRPHLQTPDESPRRSLPRGDPRDDDGRVLDGIFRER